MTPTTSFITRCRSALRSRGDWTRREFLRGAAGVVALRHLPSGVAGPQLAYVASGEGVLHVFSMQGEQWNRIQRVPSRAPACVLLCPAQRTLYVTNEVEVHEGLPRGTVESFRVDSLDGRLTLLNRQPLSLSATRPRHMALSPDGRLLAVAAFGGGIYNLFPIAKDGSLGPPGRIFKDVGFGAESAHPHSLFFDADGRHLLSSDFASGRLSVFAVDEDRLRRRMHRSTGPGSGPAASVLHPSGSFFYTWHELESMLVCYRYDGGTVGETIERIPCSGGGLGMHPSGRVLYTSQGVWQIDVESGRLARTQDVSPGSGQIAVTPGGESVYVLAAGGSICQVEADRMTGRLHRKTEVAAVNEPRSIAVKTI
jgi:6-phosphogluconolactonase